MLFTFIVAATASQALGLRPAVTAGARSAQFAKILEFTKFDFSNPSKSATVLQEVSGVVNSMVQEGNATEHLTPSDQQLLNDCIEVIEVSLYGSLNSTHDGDKSSLDLALAAFNDCYMDFSVRVGDGGDLAGMQASATDHQTALDALQDDVDAKTMLNDSAWTALQTHIAWISDAPVCPTFPSPRTMQALDLYFGGSDYATWWTAQKQAYEPVRDAWVWADQQLRDALLAYAIGLAVRDVSYCDWKRELEAACDRFSVCYEVAKDQYLNTVIPAVEEQIKVRIEAYKAGVTIVHNIKFLLAMEPNQEVGPIDANHYQIPFEDVPAKPDCDMSALDDARWVPTPQCEHCEEPVSNEADAGYVDDFRGWYDVQGCGRCNDYCRWVGNGGPGPNPMENLGHGQSWWSCRLAGTDRVYSGRDHFPIWSWTKCSGKGARAA